MATLRLKELNRLFAYRYMGETFPDDDAGRDDLFLLAHHLAQLGDRDPRKRILSVLAWHAPWMKAAEAKALVEEVLIAPTKFTADQLALRLGLTMADRMRLRIKTIGAVDCDKAARKVARAARDKAAGKLRRRAMGATPQELSKMRMKPWAALKLSRATWYRRNKREGGETDSTQQRYMQQTTNSSQSGKHAHSRSEIGASGGPTSGSGVTARSERASSASASERRHAAGIADRAGP